MSDDPPLPTEGLQDDEPPPYKFPDLLFWLRDRYTWREYVVHGKPIPKMFRHGFSERMAAECLKGQGFKRCDQTRLRRMERGEDYPGKSNRHEKQAFLKAAYHCFGLDHNQMLRTVLQAALLLYPGIEGFPPDLAYEAFEALRKQLEGDE